jgi:hypothetical protein
LNLQLGNDLYVSEYLQPKVLVFNLRGKMVIANKI